MTGPSIALRRIAQPARLAPPSSGGGQTFATPDLINNASFETDFTPMIDTSLVPPPTGVSRDSTVAFDGVTSIRRDILPNPGGDVGSQCLSRLTPTQDRVWVRFYVKLTTPISTVMKFCRFYDSSIGTNMGGFFIRSGSNIIVVGTDQENSAVTVPIGINQSELVDGNWHSLEIDYWRNGDPSGFPSMAFWLDGVQRFRPDGSAGALTAVWANGRLNAGARGSSAKMAFVEWVGTMNGGNTNTGAVYIDKVAASSLGRIGP